ncbi:COMM domain-containing protein 3-like [Pomacea canaliculata]|uniref:COMM domain-containing protein 3-like n=1 Tax=Pomacea canaliculata TaxID=400727 RepID=UPI000D73DDD2|nr:COMM domain-containing protein 3-like [Pomacea canaliculata]
MEFGSTVLDNLSVAGDAAHIPDKCFDQLVKRACRGVLSEQERNSIADDAVFKGVDKAILKSAYSGIVSLVLEAAKQDADADGISPVLEECKFTADRIKTFNDIFLSQKTALQILLGSIGTSHPHIVDVDWRLDYYIKSSQMERINEAVYLISLKTEVPGVSELQEVQFSCSLEQLQDLVGKLKDASKCMEKLAQI